LEGAELPCLVSEFNHLGGGRFADPRSKQSFRFDHLRKEACDLQPWTPDGPLESLRAAVEAEVTTYALNHFKHGVCSVFEPTAPDGGNAIIACIEDHQFQPKNYW